jgi:hypothetical protein
VEGGGCVLGIRRSEVWRGVPCRGLYGFRDL